jgi:hypothetical protein
VPASSAVSAGSPTPATPSATPPAEPQTGEAAAAAFKKWTTQYNNNEWELHYQSLVAAQKAVISEKAYVTCRDKGTAPQFKWLRLVSTKAGVKSKIAGTSVTLPATVVVARFRVSGFTLPVTAHMFYEEGFWHWSMTKENLAGCKKK